MDGNIDSAYYFIDKEATRINPKSQHGSEWIQQGILALKKKLLSNTEYLKDSSILEIHFGDGANPANLEKKNLEKLVNN